MQFLLETMRLGLSNLRLHMLRSILTALGIILGVAAVITMSSLGEGSKRQALAQIEALGARNIIVRSKRPPDSQNTQQQGRRSFMSRFGLTRQDLATIEANFGDANSIVPVKSIGSQLLRNEFRQTSQAFGTTPALKEVANLTVERGRYLNQSDLDSRAMVAVIGSEVSKDFFKLEDPLGKTIKIDQKFFTVVGVLRPVGLAGGAGGALIGRNLNQDLHVPITTATEVFGDQVFRRESGTFQASEVQISEVYLTSNATEDVLTDASRLKRLMAIRRTGLTDLEFVVPFELLEQGRKTALTFKLVFGAIAGISLLVGGIGIMNIMLASVTERTREIGIRRAIGATRKHILWQFLVETSVLSAIGGFLGVALGVGGSLFLDWGVPRLPRLPWIGSYFPSDINLPTQLTPWSIVISFGVATAVGLIFGLYPARKAAHQDPIESLRHD